MARKKKRSRVKPKEEHTHISVRVDRYAVRSEAGINYHAVDPHHAFNDPDEELLYQFRTHLEVFGTVFDPDERAEHQWVLSVYSDDAPSSRIYSKLKDVHIRDDRGVRKYRTYRGQDYPVYWTPKGIGMIEKVRGENAWQSSVFVAPRFVSDWLLLLGQGRELFLAIHEKKMQRQRWMQSVSLQTSDPVEE